MYSNLNFGTIPREQFYLGAKGCNIICYGASMSGKTTLMRNLLLNREHCFGPEFAGTPVNKLVLVYQSPQPAYSEIIDSLRPKTVETYSATEKLPAKLGQAEFWRAGAGNASAGTINLFLADDLTESAFKRPSPLENLFMVLAHHNNIVTFLNTQVYTMGGASAGGGGDNCLRTLLQNANYFLALPSPFSGQLMTYLQRSVFSNCPGNFLRSVQSDVVRDNPRGYLMVDMRPGKPLEHRVITGLLPWEEPKIFSPA